jgi:hypothetical protein
MFSALSFRVEITHPKTRTFILTPFFEEWFPQSYEYFNRANKVADILEDWLKNNTQKKYWITLPTFQTGMGYAPKHVQLGFSSNLDAVLFKLSI